MVNPVKFFTHATGLTNLLNAKEDAANQAALLSSQNKPQATSTEAPPPQPAPLVGQEAAPKKTSQRPRQFAPAILGSGASADSGTGNKTLIGQ